MKFLSGNDFSSSPFHDLLIYITVGPIINYLCSAFYDLTQLLSSFFKPYNLNSAYFLNSTCQVINDLKIDNFLSSSIIASFDAISLFTSIPTYCIYIIICDLQFLENQNFKY